MPRAKAPDIRRVPGICLVVVAGPEGAGTPSVAERSLIAQTFAEWEAVIVSRGGGAQSRRDGRVTVIGVGADADLSDALAAGLDASRAEFVAFLSAGDSVEPSGLQALLGGGLADADILYSDEINGREIVAKPAYSPERLRGQFYFGSLTAIRRSLVAEVGGVRSGLPGAEIYDLVLRASRNPGVRVAHVPVAAVRPGPLSLEEAWGVAGRVASASAERALSEHLDATGGGDVVPAAGTGGFATRRLVQGAPLVSIVIPTRGDRAQVRGVERCLVVEAVASVVERSTYPDVEIVVVVDSAADDGVRRDLERVAGDRLTIVDWTRPFSFSEKINAGVLHSSGDFVVMLNDDVEVITPHWLERMLALAQRPRAGVVGAMLYFEDDTIQHAGHAYQNFNVTHVGLHSERGSSGPQGAFLVEREVAGVTAACAMVSRAVFVEAGGLSTLLPGSFNDVDFCLKVASLGYQNYWTPFAELYHYESRSRDPRVGKSEIDALWNRWEHLLWDSPLWPSDPTVVYSREPAN